MAPPNLEPHFEVGGTRYRCWNPTTKSVEAATEAGTSLRSRWKPATDAGIPLRSRWNPPRDS